MSIRLMSQAWDAAPFEGGSLLVLLALADFANDAGEAFPSVESLAAKARLSERQTQRALDALGLAHWVERDLNEGRGQRPDRRTNLYRVTPERGDKMTPRQRERGDTHVTDGVTFATERGDAHVTQIRQVDPSVDPSDPSFGRNEACAVVSLGGPEERMAAAYGALAATAGRIKAGDKNPQALTFQLATDLFGPLVPTWYPKPGDAIARVAQIARGQFSGDYILLCHALAELAQRPPKGNPLNYVSKKRSETNDHHPARRGAAGDEYSPEALAARGGGNIILWDAADDEAPPGLPADAGTR